VDGIVIDILREVIGKQYGHPHQNCKPSPGPRAQICWSKERALSMACAPSQHPNDWSLTVASQEPVLANNFRRFVRQDNPLFAGVAKK